MQFDASPSRKSQGYLMMALFGLAGFVLVILSFSVKSPVPNVSVLTTGVVLIALGILFYLENTRLSLIVNEDSITLQQAFSSRSILLDEIKGYRTDESGRASIIFVLVTNNNTRDFQVPPELQRRDELLTWLKGKYPDVDAIGYQESAENMREDQRFGATRVERLVKLSHAILTSLIARVLVIVIVLLDTIMVLPVNLPFMLTVFILPWAVVACISYFKGMLILYRGKSDANPAAGMLLWVGSGVILANTWMNFELYDFGLHGALLLIAIAAAITASWLSCCKNAFTGVRKKSLFAGVAAAALAYSYGLLIYTNSYHDSSVAEIRRVEIEQKYIHYGNKSKSYRLIVSPWADDFSTKTVKVRQSYYENVRVGDSLTVHIGQGRWDIPWYRIDYQQPTKN